jgi:hypothetical protein
MLVMKKLHTCINGKTRKPAKCISHLGGNLHQKRNPKMSMIQLNPTIPLTTPKGRALAHFLIDNGDEHHLMWVCFQDETGECWVWPNNQIKARDNPTMNRNLKETK